MRHKNDSRKMEVYTFMTRYMKEYGVYPTVQEIGNKLGMAKSIASKYRNRLIDDGLIEKFGRYQIKAAGNISCSSMPVVGRIACGEPILAAKYIESYIPIDEGSLGPGEYFGLIADGDSMIDAGICAGDTVYIRQQSTAEDGEIVVAIIQDDLTDGYYATLKRFYRDEENNRYVLRPENDNFDDIIVSKVDIQGVAVRVLKNLEAPKRRRC